MLTGRGQHTATRRLGNSNRPLVLAVGRAHNLFFSRGQMKTGNQHTHCRFPQLLDCPTKLGMYAYLELGAHPKRSQALGCGNRTAGSSGKRAAAAIFTTSCENLYETAEKG